MVTKEQRDEWRRLAASEDGADHFVDALTDWVPALLGHIDALEAAMALRHYKHGACVDEAGNPYPIGECEACGAQAAVLR
jgi:hypothetical protein